MSVLLLVVVIILGVAVVGLTMNNNIKQDEKRKQEEMDERIRKTEVTNLYRKIDKMKPIVKEYNEAIEIQKWRQYNEWRRSGTNVRCCPKCKSCDLGIHTGYGENIPISATYGCNKCLTAITRWEYEKEDVFK